MEQFLSFFLYKQYNFSGYLLKDFYLSQLNIVRLLCGEREIRPVQRIFSFCILYAGSQGRRYHIIVSKMPTFTKKPSLFRWKNVLQAMDLAAEQFFSLTDKDRCRKSLLSTAITLYNPCRTEFMAYCSTKLHFVCTTFHTRLHNTIHIC